MNFVLFCIILCSGQWGDVEKKLPSPYSTIVELWTDHELWKLTWEG
jgi:hypothetical protein